MDGGVRIEWQQLGRTWRPVGRWWPVGARASREGSVKLLSAEGNDDDRP